MTHDDPRITAWALGEGTAAERAEVEALLASDPSLRAEAEALRDAAGALKSGLAAEPVPALDPAHRGALEAALTGGTEVSVHSPRLLRVTPEFGAVAATLLLTLGLAIGGATGGVEFGGRGDVGARDLYVVDADLDAMHGQPATPNPTEFSNFRWRAPNLILKPSGPGGGKGGAAYGGEWEARLGDADGSIVDFQQDSLTSIAGRRLGTSGVGGGGGGAGGTRASNAQLNPGLNPRRLKSGQSIRVPRAGVSPHVAGLRISGVVNQGDEELQIFDSGSFTPAGGQLPPATTLVQIDRDERTEWIKFDGVEESGTESFSPIVENAYVRPLGEAALSTFSIDVDTAAYSIIRRCLMEQNRLPPPGALRIEELVNYFPYSYAGPAGSDPFAVHVDAASCPWNPKHRLVRVVLQGRRVEEPERPAANLVFLLDVSGSMNQPNKLPLVKQSISMLAERLQPRDRVAMVVYAGASGLALPSTTGERKAEILGALERLQAGGSTNGAAGIEQAYQVAAENFVRGGINRVVLATDGDFNVGVSDPSALVKLVEDKAKSGVFLTALGYGMDNLKDSTLEQLADKGNGNYGYIDNVNEARKVLVDQGMGTLHAIAKDVKIQVEFNPARVAAFRLLGYENRVLAAQDFADDTKDAGEIGAGHTVTAFYEVVPAGEAIPGAPVDALRYQRIGGGAVAIDGVARDLESLVVKLRWKEPEGDTSTLREVPFIDSNLAFDAADPEFRFAAAVAAFGMVLRDSEHKGDATLGLVREIAAGALSDDPSGWRAEFLTLVDRAATLKR